MSFRILLPMIIVAMFGCQTFEEPPKPLEAVPEIEYKQGGSVCLNEFSSKLQRYLESQLSEDEIKKFWNCISGTVSNFSKLTKGNNEGEYSAKSIQNFFNDYLLYDHRLDSSKYVIEDSFMEQVMNLKRTLVGGSESSFTEEELVELASWIDVFGHEALELEGHWDILFFREKAFSQIKANPSVLDEVQSKIRASFARMFYLKKDKLNLFVLSELRSFLIEFARFLKKPDENIWSNILDKWSPLVSTIKEVFTRGDGDQFLKTEWSDLDQVIPLAYSVALEFRYSLRSGPLDTEAGLLGLDRFMNQLFVLVDKVLLERNGRPLEFYELDALLLDLIDLGLFKGINVDKTMVLGAYRPVLKRILAHWEYTIPTEVTGIKPIHWMRIKEFYTGWSFVQHKINKAFADSSIQFTDWKMFEEYFPSSENVEVFTPGQKQSYEMFMRTVRRKNPTRVADDGRYLIQFHKDGEQITTKDSLTRLNWTRVLLELLIRGFAEHRWRADSVIGVTQEEFSELYFLIREMGIKLKIFDPRSLRASTRIHLEGNLFTLIGNGDDYFQFEEGVELLSSLYSSGFIVHSKVRARLIELCGIPGSSDILGYTRYEKDCFHKHVQDIVMDNIDHMREMKEYLGRMNKRSRDSFFKILFNLSWSRLTCHDSIEHVTSQQMVVIMSYIETLILRFDKNGDGKLNRIEASSSFSVFRRFIDQFIKGDDISEKNKLRGYLYLLSEGELPEVDGWWDGLTFIIGRAWNENFGDFEPVTRYKLLKVFGLILGSINAGPNGGVGDPVFTQNDLCLSDRGQ
jgi:hypothetical protein